MHIASIWIENEVTLGVDNKPHNPEDTNSDVFVTLDDKTRWVASFFSYANITTLVERYRVSGECLHGRYFWSSDMILVDVVTRERIEEVVSHLIHTNRFITIFTRCVDNIDSFNL